VESLLLLFQLSMSMVKKVREATGGFLSSFSGKGKSPVISAHNLHIRRHFRVPSYSAQYLLTKLTQLITLMFRPGQFLVLSQFFRHLTDKLVRPILLSGRDGMYVMCSAGEFFQHIRSEGKLWCWAVGWLNGPQWGGRTFRMGLD
jgi:hypothetical protein